MTSRSLILASTSPRRQELLALFGIPFDVVPPTVHEEVQGQESPKDHVRRLALEKARSVAVHHPTSLVIGSDTVIELDGAILGKPNTLEEAQAMLHALRGRGHLVHTGVALVCQADQLERAHVETVKVWMKPVSDTVLADYLATQDSLGKAGAYSIQGAGAHLIENIEGDYPAVVGLPLKALGQLLEQASLELPATARDVYRSKPYQNWEKFL